MYLLGSFVAQQFAKGAEQDDLDFFTFPEIDSTIGADAIEAPIDGYMMAAQPKNEAGAKKLLGYFGSAGGPEHRRQGRPERHRDERARPTRAATRPCRRSRSSSSVAPSPSRSSWTATPAPTSPSTVMIPAIQSFIKNPNDIDGLVNEHRAAEEEHLRELIADGDGRSRRRARSTAQQVQGNRPALGDATGSWSALMVGVPTLLVVVARLAAGDRLGPALLHQLGRDRAARPASSRSG